MTILYSVVLLVTALSCGNDSGDEGTGGGTNTIVLKSGFAKGDLSVSGTINFGTSLPAGTSVQLAYLGGDPVASFTGNEITSDKIKTASSSITFSITGLAKDKYAFWARADKDGNGSYGAGDIGGYCTDDPTDAANPDKATLIDLTEKREGIEIPLVNT